jgi:hypothetical protein
VLSALLLDVWCTNQRQESIIKEGAVRRRGSSYIFCGELMITAKISPDTRPAAGRVKTQDGVTSPSIFQLTDLIPPPLHKPTVVVAPVMQWVVVILLPRVAITS